MDDNKGGAGGHVIEGDYLGRNRTGNDYSIK